MTVVDRPVRPTVTLDLYKDIHKGIRAELFAVTQTAGRLDPGDEGDRLALADHLASVVRLLVTHAEHEDAAIQPTLVDVLPDLAARIEVDHEILERRIAELEHVAAEIATGTVVDRRAEVQWLYVDLASFTSAYLAHQDLEERLVMPALEAEVGVEAVAAMHLAIVSSIPPDEMARSLAIMLPAMNVEDRTELLAGIRQGAPPEVFAGIWSLVGSVLGERDRAAVAERFGLA